jgi:hypothetical protein
MKQKTIKKEWKKEGKSVSLSVLKKAELQSIYGGASYEWKYVDGVYQLVRVS